MFTWVIDKSKVRQKTYGVPLMICANSLICRRKDDRQISNVMELNESVAIPMRSMLMYYYLQSFCNYQDRSDRYYEVMQHLTKLMGGKAFLEQSSLKEYNGIERFIRGECKYFLGFTESLRLFEPDDYVVRLANFSGHDEDQMPLFMVDFASLGKNVREEKLLDCLDLLEIMADKTFVYDLCTAEGRLQYMLPATKSVYQELAKASGDMAPQELNYYFEVSYLLGSCYTFLGRYKEGIFYLQPLIRTRRINYTEMYINCLVNLHDGNAMRFINRLLGDIVPPMVNEDADDEEDYPDEQQSEKSFINFLKRRKAYLLVEMKEYDDAEKLLKKMLDEPDSSDFALQELAFIQKNKGK